jgi:hypothetical protein
LGGEGTQHTERAFQGTPLGRRQPHDADVVQSTGGG